MDLVIQINGNFVTSVRYDARDMPRPHVVFVPGGSSGTGLINIVTRKADYPKLCINYSPSGKKRFFIDGKPVTLKQIEKSRWSVGKI